MKKYIPVILGTQRSDRQSGKVSNWIVAEINKRHDAKAELFDVKDFNFDGGEGPELKDKNPEYRDAIVRCEAFVVVFPEYNHSFPGSLKMALDILYEEYDGKRVGMVGVTAGGFGGTRGIESLAPVMRVLGCIMDVDDLNISKVHKAFDDKGNQTDPEMSKRLDSFIESLVNGS